MFFFFLLKTQVLRVDTQVITFLILKHPVTIGSGKTSPSSLSLSFLAFFPFEPILHPHSPKMPLLRSGPVRENFLQEWKRRSVPLLSNEGACLLSITALRRHRRLSGLNTNVLPNSSGSQEPGVGLPRPMSTCLWGYICFYGLWVRPLSRLLRLLEATLIPCLAVCFPPPGSQQRWMSPSPVTSL